MPTIQTISPKSKSLQPKTSFPKQPYDRWLAWTGVIESDDWKYIMTDSVREYIFRSTYKKCRVMKFDLGTCEEIAVSVSSETYLAVQTICQKKNSEERKIRVSIQAIVNTIANRWFQHFISRFYSNKNIESGFNFENIIHEPSNTEKFVLRTEILSEVFNCIEILSPINKTIIGGIFFEERSLETLANELQLKQHQLIYRKKKAEELIGDCLKSKGFN